MVPSPEHGTSASTRSNPSPGRQRPGQCPGQVREVARHAAAPRALPGKEGAGGRGQRLAPVASHQQHRPLFRTPAMPGESGLERRHPLRVRVIGNHEARAAAAATAAAASSASSTGASGYGLEQLHRLRAGGGANVQAAAWRGRAVAGEGGGDGCNTAESTRRSPHGCVSPRGPGVVGIRGPDMGLDSRRQAFSLLGI